MDKLLMDIFKTGYMIYFPNKDKTLENQEYEGLRNSIIALREEIADSDLSEIGDIIISKINEKIEPLSDSLSKLLGLQTASSKKENWVKIFFNMHLQHDMVIFYMKIKVVLLILEMHGYTYQIIN